MIGMTTKFTCRWCGRQIAPWRFTGYLRPHKWNTEKAKEAWPDLPVIDEWCPGGTRNA